MNQRCITIIALCLTFFISSQLSAAAGMHPAAAQAARLAVAVAPSAASAAWYSAPMVYSCADTLTTRNGFLGISAVCVLIHILPNMLSVAPPPDTILHKAARLLWYASATGTVVRNGVGYMWNLKQGIDAANAGIAEANAKLDALSEDVNNHGQAAAKHHLTSDIQHQEQLKRHAATQAEIAKIRLQLTKATGQTHADLQSALTKLTTQQRITTGLKRVMSRGFLTTGRTLNTIVIESAETRTAADAARIAAEASAKTAASLEGTLATHGERLATITSLGAKHAQDLQALQISSDMTGKDVRTLVGLFSDASNDDHYIESQQELIAPSAYAPAGLPSPRASSSSSSPKPPLYHTPPPSRTSFFGTPRAITSTPV
jgi:hypothetical protein